eukprot:s2045_g13.t1
MSAWLKLHTSFLRSLFVMMPQRRRRCAIPIMAALLTVLAVPAPSFVPPRGPVRRSSVEAPVSVLSLALLGAPPALAQDVLGEIASVQRIRKDPPFFSQWPPLVQVVVPIVLIFVFGAAGSILFGGELIDKTTIRRKKRRDREQKEMKALIQAVARQEAAGKAAPAGKAVRMLTWSGGESK